MASGAKQISSAKTAEIRASIRRGNALVDKIDQKLSGDREFNPVNMFESGMYRESNARELRRYKHARYYSADSRIRNEAHFEGNLSPQEFNDILNQVPISAEDLIGLKRVGYRILEFGKFNWNIFISALKIYRTAFGDADVDLDFEINRTVVSAGIGFNESYLGFQLGHAIDSVRVGDVDGYDDVIRKSQLDDLGFHWGDMTQYQRYRFIPMFMGLRIYYYIHGFPNPPSDFVVPEGPQWPHWMVGMPLGAWATIARAQQALMSTCYPHRYQLLCDFGFLWWLPMVSPAET